MMGFYITTHREQLLTGAAMVVAAAASLVVLGLSAINRAVAVAQRLD